MMKLVSGHGLHVVLRVRGATHERISRLAAGMARMDAYGGVGTTSGRGAYVCRQAEITTGKGFRIFAVGVGSGANEPFKEELAGMGSGEFFHAEGSIE